MWPINSLLARIAFPVVVELIPCSAAQGNFIAYFSQTSDKADVFETAFSQDSSNSQGIPCLFPA
jgi:hypothetical protein